jgi:hypothetical protein
MDREALGAERFGVFHGIDGPKFLSALIGQFATTAGVGRILERNEASGSELEAKCPNAALGSNPSRNRAGTIPPYNAVDASQSHSTIGEL